MFQWNAPSAMQHRVGEKLRRELAGQAGSECMLSLNAFTSTHTYRTHKGSQDGPNSWQSNG
jgi:hypothetical protein